MTKDQTVLIVEDERGLADLFETWLMTEYTVETAYDGESAISVMNADIDCVLLDRRMPGLSGGEVLEKLRDEGYDCPMAMVTAVEPDFDIIEMGFDDYIVKPVNRDEMLGLVEELLSLTTYEDNLKRFYELASKKAALESSKSEAELAESEEYDRLVSELTQLRATAQGQIESGEGVDFSSFM